MAKRTTTKTKKAVTKATANFWQTLPKPFFVLAPMANVTDSIFRKLIAKYGKPDVTWTEFVSSDGLVSGGKKHLLHDLDYSESERPIVAQLFTGHPDAMRESAKLIRKLGFDGLDINMGCPDRAVERQGGGASLTKNPAKAVEILQSAREGLANDKKGNREIPVSIKTRIGYNKFDEVWLRTLLAQKLPALTVHLRTRKEMSEVPAHWAMMPEIIKLRDEIAPETLIIGNGDILTIEQAREYCEKYGCDGVMIGRGIFGKPWLFSHNAKGKEGKKEREPQERLKILLEHTKMFEKTYKGIKNFDVMKKHFKAYVSGWDGAKELRVKLMNTHSAKEVARVIKEYLTVDNHLDSFSQQA